jgi:tetratricopeptide (TPR) repeat protein
METQQTQEKADALLREANVLRLRGQTAEAEDRCRAALELVPDEATALEMLGDLLRGRGRLEEAADLYRRSATAAPQRPSPETKFAEITLELAERQRLRDTAALLLQHPPSPEQQRRNVMMALLLSGLFPGLGQFYNREAVKGGLLVAGSLLCLWLGGDALFRLLFTVTAARPTGPVSSLGAWFGFLGGVLWLYGVIDAVVTAQKRSAGAPPPPTEGGLRGG